MAEEYNRKRDGRRVNNNPDSKENKKSYRKRKKKVPAGKRISLFVRKNLKKVTVAGILLVSLILFFSLPDLRINSYEIINLKNADRNGVEVRGNILLGSHIYFYDKNAFSELENTDPYIDKITPYATAGKLEINVKERKRDYLFLSSGIYYYIDRTGKVLQKTEYPEEKTTLLTDDTPPRNPGSTMYDEGDKKRFLTEYRNLMDSNTSKIEFDEADIRDIRNIKLKMGNWTVLMGNNSDLKKKLNDAVNILKTVDPSEEGQIDVRYRTSPVIRKQKGRKDIGY